MSYWDENQSALRSGPRKRQSSSKICVPKLPNPAAFFTPSSAQKPDQNAGTKTAPQQEPPVHEIIIPLRSGLIQGSSGALRPADRSMPPSPAAARVGPVSAGLPVPSPSHTRLSPASAGLPVRSPSDSRLSPSSAAGPPRPPANQVVLGPAVRTTTIRVNAVERTHQQVSEVRGVMRNNLDAVMERGDKLGDLDVRADHLSLNSERFANTSRKLKQKYWWKDNRYCCFITAFILIFLGILAVIICYYMGLYDTPEAKTSSPGLTDVDHSTIKKL